MHGSAGNGAFGFPVAGGGDADGDGYPDVALSSMLADPLGRTNAGEVYLVFGKGSIGEVLDTAVPQPRILRILGSGLQETAGNEIWMDDVTGDGRADLLIGRQNFSPSPDRAGAGALTILVGGPALRNLASARQPLDLGSPHPSVTLFTVVGRARLDRMGIWMRTGDVDGDGTADLAVGADQEDSETGSNSGALYLIRGGAHLAANRVVDLSDLQDSPLNGHLIRLHPPAGSTRFHVGSTCYLADLDGNGRSEVLTSAALNRAGALLEAAGAPPGSAEPRGGSPRGTLFIAWDDHFPAAAWPPDTDLDLANLGPSGTVIEGGSGNVIFGEEIVGGEDVDGDERADLFVGDFGANGTTSPDLNSSGIGYIFYHAAQLKGLHSDLDSLPEGLVLTRILGPSRFSIASDTVALGDFDGNGLADLAFGAPHDAPWGRGSAGSVYVFYGEPGGWPARIETARGSPSRFAGTRVTEILGSRGRDGGDSGDTLCYSAAAGDLDGDGLADLIVNEMEGNGVAPEAIDVGNLLILSGAGLSSPARLDFAYFGSAPGFSSDLILTNPSTSIPITAEVHFQNGLESTGGMSLPLAVAPLELMVGIDLEGEMQVLVPPLGSVTLSATQQEGLAIGPLRVLASARLGGMARYYLEGVGTAVIGPSPWLERFLVPFCKSPGGLDTGLAFQGSGQVDQQLELTLRDASGRRVKGPLSISLPESGYTARFVSELFEAAIPPDFKGTVTVQTTAGRVAVVVLELDPGRGHFSSVPVTVLP